jgi:hypothetical protein
MGTSTINVFEDAQEFPTASSKRLLIGAFVRKNSKHWLFYLCHSDKNEAKTDPNN